MNKNGGRSTRGRTLLCAAVLCLRLLYLMNFPAYFLSWRDHLGQDVFSVRVCACLAGTGGPSPPVSGACDKRENSSVA